MRHGVTIAGKFLIMLAMLAPGGTARAQFGGPPPRDPKLPTVANPTSYPLPGTFDQTNAITLVDSTPGAKIYYTLDGMPPSPTGATLNPTFLATPTTLFDPYELISVGAVNDGVRGLKTSYTIRAVAVKDGMNPSDVVTLLYTVERRDTDEYRSEIIRPGIRVVRDYDNEKMYLITGSKKAILLDTGLGTGDLKSYVEQFTGGLPLDIILSHNHPDHILQAYQFIGASNVYVNDADRDVVVATLKRQGIPADVVSQHLLNIKEADVVDLGDRQLKVIQVPGHSPGSIMLFEEATGYLFTGDAIGHSRRNIPDALWMMGAGSPPMDLWLSTYQVFRAKVHGKVKEIFTGHNDVTVYGETYLDNLEAAVQKLVDQGPSVLEPSIRPPGVWQVQVGDRITDPNWVAVNVNRDRCLSMPPDKISTLSNLQVSAGALDQQFTPKISTYAVAVDRAKARIDVTPTATSTRYTNLRINGADVKSRSPYSMKLKPGENKAAIDVVAPDGHTTSSYTLTITRAK